MLLDKLNSFLKRIPFSWAILGWLLILLIQAWFTPIHEDEAYYWVFSQNLDWSYFDHPPAVAVSIWLGRFFSESIIGIRLFTILMQLATFALIWHSIEPAFRKKSLYFMLLVSMPLLLIYGVITTPDVPLLFFTTLTFFLYRHYLRQPSWTKAILLGIAFAGLMYSKYHGALLIIILLISNIRLLLQPKFILSGVVALLLWSPHLLWQYEHDWASFRYHLSERLHEHQWYFPLEYLGNLLVVFNPFFLPLLYKVIRKKWNNVFQKNLYFVIVGFVLFFGYQSFRDHIQPQWLVVCIIPFIILLIEGWEKEWTKLAGRAFLFTLPFVVGLRLLLMFDLLPADLDLHRKEATTQLIAEQAKERPVVFVDNYKLSSLYSFYQEQKITYSYNTAQARKNQFNFEFADTTFNNKEVLIVAYPYRTLDLTEHEGFYSGVHEYFSFDKLNIEFNQTENSKGDSNDQAQVLGEIVMTNPYSYAINFDDLEIELYAYFFEKGVRWGKKVKVEIGDPFLIQAGESKRTKINLRNPNPGKATIIGFSPERLPFPGSSIYNRYPLNRFGFKVSRFSMNYFFELISIVLHFQSKHF